MTGPVDLSVIIVTYNNCAATLACLASLYARHAHLAQRGFEVILVDNASGDDTVTAVKQSYPGVRVLAQKENVGFGAANNIGARAAHGEFLFLLNNDTLCTSPVLDELAGVLRADGRASAAAPRLSNPDGSFQLSVGFMPSMLGEWRTKRLQRACANGMSLALQTARRSEPEWVTAAALMIRADAYMKIGGFDERFFMYFEDVDLCLRLRRESGAILYEQSIAIVHLGGGSWKNEEKQTGRIRSAYRYSQLLFYAKHHGILQNVLVRCFLSAKYGFRALLQGDADARTVLRAAVLPPHTLLERVRR